MKLFLSLQALDVATTMVGLRVGLVEGSPFVALLIGGLSPIAGLLLSKVVALLLAGCCFLLGRPGVIRKINVWYAVLVIWNVCLITWRIS